MPDGTARPHPGAVCLFAILNLGLLLPAILLQADLVAPSRVVEPLLAIALPQQDPDLVTRPVDGPASRHPAALLGR